MRGLDSSLLVHFRTMTTSNHISFPGKNETQYVDVLDQARWAAQEAAVGEL
jgi:hypothetical protein